MYKELVEYIVKRLVDNADKVAVSQQSKESGALVLEVSVDAQDRGRIIGKEGQTIRSIRIFLNTLASPDQEVSVILAE